MVERLLLNIREVSELTGISVGTLYHWVSQKRIPVVRFSNRAIRFRREDLIAWLESLTEPPRDAAASKRRKP